MNEEQLAQTIDEALDALDQGEAPAAILRRYADAANELAPMLYAAQTVQQNQPTPSAAAERASRERFLAAAATRSAPAAPTARPSFIMRLAQVLAPVAVVVMLALGVFAVAEQTLPGDALYPLKLWSEEVRGTVSGSAPADTAARRQEEVRALIREGRQEKVAFPGVVESVDGDRWLVSGIAVQLDEATVVPAGIEPGDRVQIVGRTEFDWVVAERIEPVGGEAPPAVEPTLAPGATVEPSELIPAPLPEDDDDIEETPTPAATPTLAPTPDTTPTDDYGDDGDVETPEADDGDDNGDDSGDDDDGNDDDDGDDNDNSGSSSEDDDDDDSSGSDDDRDDDDSDDDDDDGETP